VRLACMHTFDWHARTFTPTQPLGWCERRVAHVFDRNALSFFYTGFRPALSLPAIQ
jgi:hypothetical protein